MKHDSVGTQRSGCSAKSSTIIAWAPAGSPDSSLHTASAEPGPPPTDGMAPPVSRPPTRSLSLAAAAAASRWPAKYLAQATSNSDQKRKCGFPASRAISTADSVVAIASARRPCISNG